MRSARNQLILLGFICQGLSWDDYTLPLLNITLWVLCVTVPRGPLRINSLWELVALLSGTAAAFAAGSALGQNIHFFIGHGLTLLQAIRLVRPLARRDKIFSLFVACMQIAVGCTVVWDYRFIGILLGAFFLLPRALFELELDEYPASEASGSRKLRSSHYATIAVVMILFFLSFPRGLIGTLPAQRFGRGDEGALSDMLDAARSGERQSGRVVLQIEGKDLENLRCFALAEFDGVRWSMEKRPRPKRDWYWPESRLTNAEPRRVRVKQVRYLGRTLPTDGHVVHLQGRFFRNVIQTVHRTIECAYMWNTPRSVYSYWVDRSPRLERLAPVEVRMLTEYPAQSARLQKWLDELLTGLDDPLAQAKRIESHLKNNFTYELGTPELSRLAPTDDFVFNQRRGHCERFASTLALLLRMKGIPSRVMIGYVVGSQDWLSGWSNVRFRDAHAWVEGYFPNSGWVALDGTPRADYPPSSFYLRDLIEAVDVIWYLNILNFDRAAQTNLAASLLRQVAVTGQWISAHRSSLVAWAIAAGAVAGLRIWKIRWPQRRARRDRRRNAQWVAAHYYSRLLASLARQGIERQPTQTPFELLDELKRCRATLVKDADLVTQHFCRMRYGGLAATPADEQEIEAALRRVEEAGRTLS